MTNLRNLTLLAAATLLLSGCAVLNAIENAGPSAPSSVTGNWSFSIVSTTGNTTINSITGSLISSGTTVNGVLRGLGGCVSPTLDLVFTGTETASGLLTLTSTTLPTNPITLTSTVLTLGGETTGQGSVYITGTGPCAMPQGSVLTVGYPALTGTYTGTLTSSTNASMTFTSNLTQSAANADGLFPESGTVTLATATCSNTFSLTGLVSGPTLTSAIATTTGNPATGTVVVLLSPQTTQTNVPINVSVLSTGCLTGNFNGFLNKQ